MVFKTPFIPCPQISEWLQFGAGDHLGFQACDTFLHLGIVGDQGKEESILNVSFPFSFLASVILQIEFLCR